MLGSFAAASVVIPMSYRTLIARKMNVCFGAGLGAHA